MTTQLDQSEELERLTNERDRLAAELHEEQTAHGFCMLALAEAKEDNADLTRRLGRLLDPTSPD